MATSSIPLLAEVDVPTIRRALVGTVVQIVVREVVVYQFDEKDSTGRDVAIAALSRLRLTTDLIGSLCGASHGWVCSVRKRLRVGGLAAVVARGRAGRPTTIQGAARAKLIRMMAEGARCAHIARELGVAPSVVHGEMARVRQQQREQLSLVREAAAEPMPATLDAETTDEAGAHAVDLVSSGIHSSAHEEIRGEDSSSDVEHEMVVAREQDELTPGALLPSGPTEHPTRYAGALLIAGALSALGIEQAISASRVARPKAALYDATTVLFAMMTGWSAGFVSLESMHERDARSLGVLLGLERSPSVRTIHRAFQQMCATFDPSVFTAAWIRALAAAALPNRLCFGIDGHFKPYAGDAPIDKGWDSKRRIATKGIADVVVTDERGWMWSATHVDAGDALSSHLLAHAKELRAELGDTRPIVLVFDRGGFAFDVLNALDTEGFGYVTYVPQSVTLPTLATIAPEADTVGESAWAHPKLHHRARLLVERDGDHFIPVATNLTTLVDAGEVVAVLRTCRGAQENAFKAARAHAHIDRLVDRGGATRAPDDRPVHNPERTKRALELATLRQRASELAKERAAQSGRTQKEINDDRFRVAAERQLAEFALKTTPARVPRMAVYPTAEKATLDTTNRMLLQPMKLATDNARRWLLAALHDGLVPTDATYDADTTARTLAALLHSPGTVRFDDEVVHVTIDLPLPPTAHMRLDNALRTIGNRHFCFTDGRRRLAVKLATRATRATLPHLSSTAK